MASDRPHDRAAHGDSRSSRPGPSDQQVVTLRSNIAEPPVSFLAGGSCLSASACTAAELAMRRLQRGRAMAQVGSAAWLAEGVP